MNQTNQGIPRQQLANYLNEFLEVARFKDYCPNGLQVEGSATIERIVTGVTASQQLLDKAVSLGADTVLVHHGYFWKGEDSRITGIRRQRLKTLLTHDINLFGFHLPLDAHPTLGNNAQLAQRFGWTIQGQFGEQNIACIGSLAAPTNLSTLQKTLHTGLGRDVLLVTDNPNQTVSRIGWCSGGGDSYFESAIAQGVEVFVSGEISEPAVHLARESGVAYLAAGHHATERDGVRALGEHLVQTFGVQCTFVDVDNPA